MDYVKHATKCGVRMDRQNGGGLISYEYSELRAKLMDAVTSATLMGYVCSTILNGCEDICHNSDNQMGYAKCLDADEMFTSKEIA
jgi:hypothetical protein